MPDSTSAGSAHTARIHHHRARVHQAHTELHGAALEAARKHYAREATGGAQKPPATAEPTSAGETPPVVR